MALSSLTSSKDNNTSLSSFRIEKQIGKGQYSVVYRAVCKTSGRTVALKKIQFSEMLDEKSMRDCIKEIDLLQQLDHPNIIKHISSFFGSNELHIALELADGGDLAGLLNYAKSEKLLIDEKTIWKIFEQVTLALQHMHAKRIMHRDIKPANVFITKSGTVKLGDLGLGRFFSCKTNAAHSLVGTPYYMSPERIRECGYNFKSDIWSVGCLLYELAALQSPFYGDKMNFYTLCKKIELCDYPPIPCDLYSRQLQDLVCACLRLDPASRPEVTFVHETSRIMNNLFQSSKNVSHDERGLWSPHPSPLM